MSGRVRDTKSRYIIALALSIGSAIFYLVMSSWDSEAQAISSDILFVVVAGGCSLLGVLAVKRQGIKGRLSAAYLGVCLGVFLWFLGELTWSVYEVGLGIPVPYPSIADFFYLAGYVPMALGILWCFWIFKEAIDRSKVVLSVLFGVFVVGLTGLFLLGPLLIEPVDVLTRSFDLAYPILDVAIMVLCIFVVLVFREGVMDKPWIWISLGIALNVVADIIFSYGTLIGWYYSGHPSELLYLWGYICIGLGFQTQ